MPELARNKKTNVIKEADKPVFNPSNGATASIEFQAFTAALEHDKAAIMAELCVTCNYKVLHTRCPMYGTELCDRIRGV